LFLFAQAEFMQVMLNGATADAKAVLAVAINAAAAPQPTEPKTSFSLLFDLTKYDRKLCKSWWCNCLRPGNSYAPANLDNLHTITVF
jgi:hypothetical protein